MNSLTPSVILGIGIVAVLAGLVMLLLVANYGQLWFQAYWSKSPVTFLELLGMSLRKVNARTIVQAKIMSTQAGLGREISVRKLEAHYLAGGDVPRVTRALLENLRGRHDDQSVCRGLALEALERLRPKDACVGAALLEQLNHPDSQFRDAVANTAQKLHLATAAEIERRQRKPTQEVASRPSRLLPLLPRFGMATAVTLQIVVTLACHEFANRAKRAEVSSHRAEDALPHVESLVKSVLDAEAAQRNYVVNGAKYFLQSYERANERVETELRWLQSLQSEPLAPSVSTFAERWAAKSRRLDEGIALVHRGQRDEVLRRFRNDPELSARNRLLAEAAEQVAQRQREQTRRAQEANKHSLSQYVLAQQLASFISGALLLMLAFLIRADRRRRAARTRGPLGPGLPISEVNTIGNDAFDFLLDVHTTVISLSPRAISLTGWAETDALGKPFARLFTKKDSKRGIPARVLRTSRETGGVVTEFPLARPGRAPLFTSWNVRPLIENDNLRGYIVALSQPLAAGVA